MGTAGRVMSRLARGHVESEIRERFPGRDVTVETTPGGTMRIEISGRRGQGGTLIAITGDQPGTILAALMSPPDEED